MNLQNLQNPAEKTVVSKVIDTPKGEIEIYEPTAEQADKIIEMLHEKRGDLLEGEVEFNSHEVLKVLIPMFTNLEYDGLEEEEIDAILINPNVYLIEAVNEVSKILSSINNAYYTKVQAQIAEGKSIAKQKEMIDSFPRMLDEFAEREPVVKKALERIDKVTEQIKEDINPEDGLDNAVKMIAVGVEQEQETAIK